MSNDSMMFLILVLPGLVLAGLVYLGILAVGLSTIVAAFKSAHPVLRGTLVLAGVLVILSPVLFHTGMDMRAQHKADRRQAHLAQLERASLAGRMPARFITSGNFGPELRQFIRTRYRLAEFPEAENRRLVEAYRAYRRAGRCHRRFPGNPMMRGTKLPSCKPLPDSVQSALGLRAPILVFAEGFNTSMREDNILAGEIYEIRLITPEDDLLVAYFEERTVEDKPGIFNQYASGRRNASSQQPPTLKAFIETAMKEAGQ